MKTIGVIGTAKNTGKTTTLSFLLKGFQSRGLNIAVTGIGYDGEEIDNITSLPKPRLHFEKNCILATSEKCLQNTDAEYIILEETKFATALGKIFIVEITKPGKVVIAGPNTVKSLNHIIEIVKSLNNIDILLVDGSLNRISPMYILDKLIFTTGASRNTLLNNLVLEMSAIEKVFAHSIYNDGFNGDDNLRIVYDGVVINLYHSTLVDDDDFLVIACSLNNKVEKIVVPGILSIEALIKHLPVIKKKVNKSFEFIFNSPIQLLLTEDISRLTALLKLFNENDIFIRFRYKPDLAAVTINPFYPKLENYKFIPSYLDKEQFYLEMSGVLNTPVFNVMENNAEKLFNLL